MVRGDAFENARKRTGLDRLVVGNDLVMLAVAWGCHSHVRSLLPSNIVAENPQSLDELRPRHVSRQLHRAKTSSRTK